MEYSPTGASRLSEYIKPVTVREAFRLSPLLRVEDQRELIGAGLHPMMALPLSVGLSTDPIKFLNQDGQIAGLAGVVDEGSGIGRVWMLCTPAVEQMPFSLFRGAKNWLETQPYLMLHNIADPRNRIHLKLLHMLGFKRLSYVPVGPQQRTYVEFAKLCVHPL